MTPTLDIRQPDNVGHTEACCVSGPIDVQQGLVREEEVVCGPLVLE